MGIRHLTVVLNERKEEIVNIYGQFDGYPTGQGTKLKKFLEGFEIINGYTLEDERKPKCANGMGCLAAQLIAHLKMGDPDPAKRGLRSSYHIKPPGARELGEEYIYTIYLPIDDLEDYYSWEDDYELIKKEGRFVKKKKQKLKPKLHIKIQSGRMAFFGLPGTPPDQMNVLYDGPVDEFDPEKVDRR